MSSSSFVLGLTGGIGTGKSTAAKYLADRGFDHVDADAISRDLTAGECPMLDLLEEIFGGGEEGSILLPGGRLDRKKLAGIVFSDPAKKARLDEIMFREIGRIIVERIAAAEGPVLLDAPLLFEAGLDELCDHVILIVCDLEVRLERVCARDGARREEVLDRIRTTAEAGKNSICS